MRIAGYFNWGLMFGVVVDPHPFGAVVHIFFGPFELLIGRE